MVGTVIITAVMYLNGTGVYTSLVTLPAGFEGWVLSIALQGGLALPIILGNVILFISVPILADRYERHSTFAGKELAIMLKLTFFQVFNTCVAAAAFLVDPNVWSNSRHWYTLGGALLANVTLGDAIFIQLLLDFVQLPVLINRCFIAPRLTTQQAMDESYAAPAGIYLAYRLQLAGKFVVLCTMFGSAIPSLYAIATIYFWMATWIDRYNLLRRLAPPPVTDASLTAAVAIIVFPIAILLHVLMALWFFSSLARTLDQEHAALPSPAPPIPPFPPPGEVSSGDFPSPPPPIPPTYPSPFVQLHSGWDAYHIQLGTAAVTLIFLISFGLKEIFRRYGIRLKLLSDAGQRVILRVFTQEPDEAQQQLVAATSLSGAHRSEVYLPPLAPPLLAELGLTQSARRAAVTAVREVSSMASAAADRPGLISRRSSILTSYRQEGGASPGRGTSGNLSVSVAGAGAPSSVAPSPLTNKMREVALGDGAAFDQLTRTGWKELRRQESRGVAEPPSPARGSAARVIDSRVNPFTGVEEPENGENV